VKHLTVDRLHSHLFSQSKYPSWNGDIEKLIFGVESEYLVLRQGTQDEYLDGIRFLQLLDQLKTKHSYKQRSSEDIWRISKDTEWGFVTIKPDFGFHILEISYPPRGCPRELRVLIKRTLTEVDEALDQIDFERAPYGVVRNPEFAFECVQIDRLKNFIEQFSPRTQNSSKYYFPHFPAMIAATQVHLNISHEGVFRDLTAMYELEWKIVDEFSTSTQFNNEILGCARTLLYEETLSSDYRLKNIPNPIPTDIESYVELFNSSRTLFKHDTFFPVRDMTAIRPRPFGSIEFRSTCTQGDVDRILGICAYRAAQVMYGAKFRDQPLSRSAGNAREALLHRSRYLLGAAPVSEYEQQVNSRFEEIIQLLPSQWRCFVNAGKPEARSA